jgi:hypothetical protein
MALGWFILGAAAGTLGTLALVRKGTVDPYAANPSWEGFIRGEYWIDSTGESHFADVDVGDKGHEAIALDMLLDKDALVEGLIEYYEGQTDEYKEQYDVDGKLAELASYLEDDEMDSSNVYVLEYIPDEAGIAGAGGDKQLWEDIQQDVRLAFAKHTGAIAVVDTNFYAWKVTKDTLKRILDFLYEELDGEDGFIAAKDKMIWIEEGSKNRTTGVTLAELLDLESPSALWGQKHEPGLSEWLQTHDPEEVREKTG